ncbi:oligopeptide transport system permease protein [Austwickia chelonae]|uniref:Putative peptide ABC transporter permease protein n=1 Tax=Austwickia chelonae NBRC 105200 TaxID=1184607 RepID=K6W7A8_9MICO|nr:ABC transporter permease [Austwickia chelonae]GAB77712.1 putative peptide ABC transporter permease protein [Austwickia chelonae NBRC 105200]SEW16335.1 oligopeptide transport system permease protein [Austwickia chelonae]
MTDATAETLSPTPSPAPDGGESAPGRSLTQDARRQLRKRPLFWIASSLILVFLSMALFPGLFTSVDPNYGELSRQNRGPGDGALFGFDHLGRDVYARSVYSARASIMVGLLTTLATATFGSVLGIIAGFYGGWVDAVISRITDMVFAIPMLLGGILFMSTWVSRPNDPYALVVFKVVFVLMLFGWPGIARLMRSSVLQIKQNEYVLAARALGASPLRIIVQHILPNAMAPVLVIATIHFGAYIAAEATLSFLGIGLQYPATSWGTAINGSLSWYQAAPHNLLCPAIFLSVCVLAFMTLGDVVRDAFDPKQR